MGVDDGVDLEGHFVGATPLSDAKEGAQVVHVLLMPSYLSVCGFVETVARNGQNIQIFTCVREAEN